MCQLSVVRKLSDAQRPVAQTNVASVLVVWLIIAKVL